MQDQLRYSSQGLISTTRNITIILNVNNMIEISLILIIAMILVYPKAWRFVEDSKEDDSDII